MILGRIVLVVSIVCVNETAHAFFFNSGIKQTMGTGNYSGTDLYADFGGDWHVRPSFSSYHSDASSGTFRTLSIRLGYDTQLFGVGIIAGGSPKVNGYRSRFFGIDGIVSLTPGGLGPIKRITGSGSGSGAARGKGLARIDLGAGLTHTTHTDDYRVQFSGVTRNGREAVISRLGAVNIGQTDLNASVGVSLLQNLISLDITKSMYNQDLAGILARSAQVEVLSGLSATIKGFPDTSAHLRLETVALPFIEPFLSYTRTTFRLGQSVSHAYGIGAYAQFQILEFNAAFERYVQAGSADQNYYGIGASARF